MMIDWRNWQARSPRTFVLVLAAKRLRTKAGVVLVLAMLGESLYNHEVPLDIDEPDWRVGVTLLLIAVGCVLRIAAHGVIKKKEALATRGVYSPCRHPLYLGSILIASGFCTVLNDGKTYLAAGAYFLLFYTVTIAWEEIRLRERFGDAHAEYARGTPVLLPFGRFRPDHFHLGRAFANGGGILVAVVVVLLGLVEVAAEIMPHWSP